MKAKPPTLWLLGLQVNAALCGFAIAAISMGKMQWAIISVPSILLLSAILALNYPFED